MGKGDFLDLIQDVILLATQKHVSFGGMDNGPNPSHPMVTKPSHKQEVDLGNPNRSNKMFMKNIKL